MSGEKIKIHGATSISESEPTASFGREQTIKVLEWITAVSTQAPIRNAAQRLITELSSGKNDINKKR
jgi:hypothetical protein